MTDDTKSPTPAIPEAAIEAAIKAADAAYLATETIPTVFQPVVFRAALIAALPYLATPAPADNGAGVRTALEEVIHAWEATKAGDTTKTEIQRWLIEDMKPAIDAGRSALVPATSVAEPSEAEIEAGARAIYEWHESLGDQIPFGTLWLELDEIVRQTYRDESRAALVAASRTPPVHPAPVDGKRFARERDVPDQMVFNALHARVPGGAEVWHWLPQEIDEPDNPSTARPHPTAHEVIRSAIFGALQSSPVGERDETLDTEGMHREFWRDAGSAFKDGTYSTLQIERALKHLLEEIPRAPQTQREG